MSVGVKFRKWLTGCREACLGLVIATREWRFWLVFAISFIVFGTLLNLLNSSLAALNLFWVTDFGGKLHILGDAFLANFGIGRALPDFLLNLAITILQSLLFASIFAVWHKNRSLGLGHRSRRSGKSSSDCQTDHSASEFSLAGLATGLAVLGAGCPTCGTTIITPVLVALASTSGYALAGVISGILTAVAVILAFFALRRTGLDYYNLATGRFSCKLKSPVRSSPTQSSGKNPPNISPDE